VHNHLLGGAVGGLAVLVGIAWAIGSLRRRATRALEPREYAEMGGVVYTIFQMFFAVVLVGIGLIIIGLMFAGQ